MAESLGDIDGVGRKAVKQFKSMGIESLDDLARADANIVNDHDVSIRPNRMQKFINRAKESAIIIQTGEEVKKEYDNKLRLTTGIEKLDNKLGGGWQENHVIAVGGGTGSGKTQLAFQSCGEAVQQTGKPAVYIETEPDRYTGGRIQQMFDKETQQKVHKISIGGDDALDQQLNAYRAVANQMDDVSLVVVDSFTARFRLTDEFDGRDKLTSRSAVFSKHLTEIEKMSNALGCPVLLICQVYSNPTQYGSNIVIYGSSVMMHIVNYVVKMKGRKGALTKLMCRNHPEVGEFDMLLQINNDGIDYAD